MLTAQQVQDAIENPLVPRTESWTNPRTGETQTYEIDHREFYGDWYKDTPKTITVDGVDYEVTKVDEYGGMDMGTELWVVFKIGDQMFKKYGAYYSHDGSYWDGSLDEVRPVQKTITVFE